MPGRNLSKWGNRILAALALVSVAALLLATVSLMWLNREQSARERLTIATQVAACERGNARGEQIIKGFGHVDDAITGVLDVFLGGVGPERSAAAKALREKLDEPLQGLDDARTAIEIVDCKAVTPGATQADEETK